MGGILHQWQKDKDGTDRLKVICYGSKTLNKAQRNYAAPKLEMLAALTFIEKYANYLLGRKFVLRVDNKALEWILTMGMHNNPLAMRWVTRLQEFLFEVQHRKREKHTNADGISKITDAYVEAEADNLPTPLSLQFLAGDIREQMDKFMLEYLDSAGLDNTETKKKVTKQRKEDESMPDNLRVCLVRIANAISPKRMAEEQDRDQTLKKFKYLVKNKISRRSNEYYNILDSFEKIDKMWFKRDEDQLKVNKNNVLVKLVTDVYGDEMAQIIPLPRRYHEILQTAHDQGGHNGMSKMVKTVMRKFDWPGAQQDILEYTNSSLQCQANKPMNIKPVAKLKSIETSNPNELLQIDHLKMKPIKKNGKTKYVGVLMMVDHYTKYCVVKKVKSFDAKDTAKAIYNGWIRRCGFPDIIHSDQGSVFEGEMVQQLMKLIGAVKIHGSVYRPQTQGGVERVNQTITKITRILSNHPDEWPKNITSAEIAYNTKRR